MKSTAGKMIAGGYTLAIIAFVMVFFHKEISHNPNDTIVKNVALGILIAGALLRVTGSQKKKKENPML